MRVARSPCHYPNWANSVLRGVRVEGPVSSGTEDAAPPVSRGLCGDRARRNAHAVGAAGAAHRHTVFLLHAQQIRQLVWRSLSPEASERMLSAQRQIRTVHEPGTVGLAARNLLGLKPIGQWCDVDPGRVEDGTCPEIPFFAPRQRPQA